MKRAIVSLSLLVACAKSTPEPAELVRESQDQVRRFFAVAESGDCKQLQPMMQNPHTCDGMVTQFKETRAHLVAIEEAKLDGRDKQLVLVSVNVQSTKMLHHWIVRAKWTPTGWKVAL